MLRRNLSITSTPLHSLPALVLEHFEEYIHSIFLFIGVRDTINTPPIKSDPSGHSRAMHFLKEIPFTTLGAVVVFTTASSAKSIPVIEPRVIISRYIQSINDCGSNEAKVRQDFADAAAMANLAFNNLNAESNA